MNYNRILIKMNEWVDIINSQKTFCPKSFLEIWVKGGERGFFKKKTNMRI